MTTRFIALLAVCIAIALVSVPWKSESVLTETGREFDIAIIGRGNLCLFDVATNGLRYTRCGSLHLNRDSQLVVSIQGTDWPIEPSISVPAGWEGIRIRSDGTVQAYCGYWTTVGQLHLAVFPGTSGFSDPLAANSASPSQGVPMFSEPGDGAGEIRQLWLESRTAYYQTLATRVLIAILVTVFVAYLLQVARSTRVDATDPVQSHQHQLDRD